MALGMVPDGTRAAVIDGLAEDVRAHGGHLNTGILGTPALLAALTHNGHAELAYRLTAQTTYPSWGEWLAAGADTLWEEWGMDGRSRNHPMHGTVDEWFYRDVAGLAPDPAAAGYRHFVVRPYPTPALTRAAAGHDSPYGRISVAWWVENGAFSLTAEVPVNTTATIRLPSSDLSAIRESGGPADRAPGVRHARTVDAVAEFQVGSGSYHFVCANAIPISGGA